MHLFIWITLAGLCGHAVALLPPVKCRKAALACTSICNARGNCQVSRLELETFFHGCRSLFQWDVCLAEVLLDCSPAAVDYVEPMVKKIINNLKNHCDEYLCDSGVERCFGTLRIVRNAKTKVLTPPSLANLCSKKPYLTACYRDLNRTQDVYSCPGARSEKTPQYLEYWDVLETQCDPVDLPDPIEEPVPNVDDSEEKCLEKARACSELCQGDTCRMESEIMAETLANCKSLFDWEFCLDQLSAEECPENSAAVADVRAIINTFKDKCEQDICNGGVEKCFKDIQNFTLTEQGRDGLTRDDKITLCNSGVSITECRPTLDQAQVLYGCRGVTTDKSSKYQLIYDFVFERCDKEESFIDVPLKSDFECLEDFQECTHLCTDGTCTLPYQTADQFINDCTSLSAWRECVDEAAEECPTGTPSLKQIRDAIKTMSDHCENTLCSSGVELCFQGQSVVVDADSGDITDESLNTLCASVGPIEECASALAVAQIEFSCRAASSNSTRDFKGFLRTMQNECLDPSETTYTQRPRQPESLDEENCLYELEKCTDFCADGVCRLQWITTEEMISKCSTIPDWSGCVSQSETLCPVNSTVYRKMLDAIKKFDTFCEINTCDGGVEQCFDGIRAMRNATNELSEDQTSDVCNRAGQLQICGERLEELQASYECPDASSGKTGQYNDLYNSLGELCNEEDELEEINEGPDVDDECRIMAAKCSYLCSPRQCRMRWGSRMELFRNCEHLFEFEECLEGVEAMCEPERVADYRTALKRFQRKCDQKVCEGGVEGCFEGVELIVEQGTGALAEAGMDELCPRAPTVAECAVTMEALQALYDCSGAWSNDTANFTDYYDDMTDACGISVEEGTTRDKIRLSCNESSFEALYCMTCEGENEDDCVARGELVACEGEEPVCEHTVVRNGRGKVKEVRRRCCQVGNCHDQTYGFNSEQCSSNNRKKICTRCTYDGAQCVVEDIDECAEGVDECDDNATCNNTIGSYTCTCRRGFSGNGRVCTDNDECSDGNNDCDENAVCTNEPGSYACTCEDGYAGNGRTCTDIDECQTGSADCAQEATCTNTAGSFQCQCKAGYSGSGVVCKDINECEEGTDNCAEFADCSNVPGSFTCTCREGFSGNGVSCLDDDECTDGTHDCAPQAECINTVGGHECVCSEGYTGDGKTCTDIDECQEGLSQCGDYADCYNEPGTYVCECQAGYYGDGQTCLKRCDPGFRAVNNEECVDIDECAENINNCVEEATCENIPGSYTCQCNPGFEGDGTYCNDVDECARGTDDCDDKAVCENNAGSYTCSCQRGYVGDGRSCDDVDECANNSTCGTNADCYNTPGSFVCECHDGYTLYGRSCVDIDECLGGSSGCDEKAICTNLPGSFECKCPPNMYGDGTVCEKDCVCVGKGDPRFTLYDGQSLVIIPSGDYLLSESTDPNCPFRVVATILDKDPVFTVMYISSLSVEIGMDKVELNQTRILVNGLGVAMPYRGIEGVSIRQTKNAYRLETSCGLKAVWDPDSLDSKVRVLVPPQMGSSVEGMCGNCNGVEDDLRGPNGQVMEASETVMAAIGRRYRISEQSGGRGPK